MDEKVRGLLQELGDMISETVTASPRIESLMDAIRHSGYEVCLIVEATEAPGEGKALPGSEGEQAGDGFTPDDQQFLRRLKIKC